MKKIIFLFIVCTQLMSSPVRADDIIKTTQLDIMTVAAAGLGGGVLGLTTLSFVDEPSNHVSNIWTGAAIGVIAGVIYVALNSAQKNSEELQSSAEFSTRERFAWHKTQENLVSFEKSTLFTPLWGASF